LTTRALTIALTILLLAVFGPALGAQQDRLDLEETPAVVTETGERGAHWVARDGSRLPFTDDAALLAYLKTARVVEWKPVGKGISKPKRLVLEKDGIRARAVYHDIRIRKTRQRLSSGELVMFFRDSYENNIAAYKLSRLMGLTTVPPATLRRVEGKYGSVQLWIEGSHDEEERRRRGAEDALPILVRRSIADMWVFDNLINNTDRNQGNMLYDSGGAFWWIDHTRAFARGDRLLNPERINRCSRSMRAALEGLDQAAVKERLGSYLNKSEIKSLFRRRDSLLELLEEKIASLGETRFLFSYADPDDSVSVSYGETDIPEASGSEG